ncbi:MAG: winged helix DNA-binding domain-containing protein [Gemmatimonadaceae bacterium]|nr:winged helix DNA-binding domain-containing protein [Gemmatimonadaceae bacterium]
MPRPITLDALRRHAIARSLTRPTTLGRAITRLGYVQADPIRAPARAQDLILRHRVHDYVAGDLEARYPRLDVEEDYFVNYGFLPRALADLMHPRTARRTWSARERRRAEAVLAFVRERRVVHPNEVDAHFAHGHATNWFGGRSRVSTPVLDGMHYRGLLRIARRSGGIRVYAARDVGQDDRDPIELLDTLLDVAVRLYAPLPASRLGYLLSGLLHYGAPQWRHLRRAALARARARAAGATVDGVPWLWPADERPSAAHDRVEDRVRLLAPFDPVVWDRLRFEHFWGWAYRFEAYTPAPKRVRGYYALPLLWRDAVIGWANVSVVGGALVPRLGYVTGSPPTDVAFRTALEAELADLARFLGCSAG